MQRGTDPEYGIICAGKGTEKRSLRAHMRSALVLAAVVLLAAAMAGPAGAASGPLAERTGFFFDTVITVSLYDTDDGSILDECFEKMAYFESIFSRTREGSDIWNIDHAGGSPVTVSEETADLIRRALEWCEISDGALDITIAPVVDLWDFHEDSQKENPEQEALAKAASHVDYKGIRIEGNEVTLEDPKAGLDLGAIAKGYISDRVREIIVGNGCGSALINLGGNVLAVGKKPDGKDFNIGIRRPFGESALDLVQVVPASDLSVITSGTYERYFEKDGVIYHHILDPDTGYPIENGLTSVSILSEDATDGDALSTTCFALGLEKGMELIESLDGIEAMMIDEDGTIYSSSGWTGRDYP